VPVPGVPLAATVHLAPRNLVCELSTLLAPFFHRRTSALDLRVAGSFFVLMCVPASYVFSFFFFCVGLLAGVACFRASLSSQICVIRVI